MVSTGRAQRIAQRIQEELSTMLLVNISDPRLEGIFVSIVRVDRELAYANIFVSALEGSERKEEIIQGLERASGYIRRELTHRVDLRSFPRLRFYWDPSPEHAERIDEIIASLDEDGEPPENG
jgi:ribosome-binding factor A